MLLASAQDVLLPIAPWKGKGHVGRLVTSSYTEEVWPETTSANFFGVHPDPRQRGQRSPSQSQNKRQRTMGCSGSKAEGGAGGAGSPPGKQAQEGQKDAAAAEIQGAAAAYMKKKSEADFKLKQDAAAADIQGAAAGYLAKKREGEAAKEGEGIMGGIMGIFSQRAAPAAAPAAA